MIEKHEEGQRSIQSGPGETILAATRPQAYLPRRLLNITGGHHTPHKRRHHANRDGDPHATSSLSRAYNDCGNGLPAARNVRMTFIS